MVFKYFLFSHQSKIQRLRRKIQATKTLKNFRFKFATEKTRMNSWFFSGILAQTLMVVGGREMYSVLWRQCSSIQRCQLDIASGKCWGFYLAFSKEVTLLEVNWSSGGSVYTNLVIPWEPGSWDSPLPWAGSRVLFQSRSPYSHYSVVQQFSIDTDVVKQSWRKLLYKQYHCCI